METDERLSKTLIQDTSMWRLALRLEPHAVHVVLYSTIEDNSLIYRRVPLDGTTGSYLRVVEDVIYDNPLLLGDFDRVYCVIATDCVMLTPVEYAGDADDCILLLRSAFPDFDGDVLASPTGSANATLLMGVDSALVAFLNRTFIAPRIYHHLSPLTRYFMGAGGKGNGLKTFLHLRSDSLDIVITDRGRLLLANTFRYYDINDALYYTLACHRQLAIDNSSAELLICGDTSAREALMPMLRDYVARVMPVIFPSSMFRAGKEAMKAPFDLIVLPLCE